VAKRKLESGSKGQFRTPYHGGKRKLERVSSSMGGVTLPREKYTEDTQTKGPRASDGDFLLLSPGCPNQTGVV